MLLWARKDSKAQNKEIECLVFCFRSMFCSPWLYKVVNSLIIFSQVSKELSHIFKVKDWTIWWALEKPYQQSFGDFLVTEQCSGVWFKVNGCFSLRTYDNILFSARVSFQIPEGYAAAVIYNSKTPEENSTQKNSLDQVDSCCQQRKKNMIYCLEFRVIGLRVIAIFCIFCKNRFGGGYRPYEQKVYQHEGKRISINLENINRFKDIFNMSLLYR